MLVLEAADRILALGGRLGRDGQLGDRPAFLLLGIEPGIVQDQEDELGPAEVARVGGGQLAAPVVAEAQHLELPAEGGDVLLGGRAGVGARLLGVLLGRQAEGVPAHRVQNALAPHPLEAADDVGGRIAFRVADVQSLPARVGKHVQDVHLLRPRQAWGGEGLVFFPVFLPLGFDNGRIIARHGHLTLRVPKREKGDFTGFHPLPQTGRVPDSESGRVGPDVFRSWTLYFAWLEMRRS